MTRSTSDRSRPLLLWVHRDCHFDDIGTARDVYHLDDAAVNYAAVGIDYDQELGIFDQLLAQEIAERRLVDRLLVEKESIVFVDGNRGAFGGSLPAGCRFGQIDRHAFVLRHGQSRDHEKNQEEKNRVDHRNDLDARFFHAAALDAHQWLSACTCNWSSSDELKCSI